ncbi:hypothetical protein [Aquimarina algiphila]|uniref:hypothetical protein n=1 Tax=Aquimarina algiphila TaxID=2047982 RepID=UPI00232FF5A4|nr:hypothetical protein [Aquimarina algiphila]
MGKNTFELVENGTVLASTSIEISDFAPIVVINEDEEGENAMWSTQNCSISKKEKLTLSDDFDEDLREYIVPEIVIAQNSTSKIPLKIKQGYDDWWDDNDGIIEFTSSNDNVIISIEGVDSETKNEKEVEYGDEIIIEVSFKNRLNRGQKFSIDIKGKDGENIEVSGKLNFTIIEKDVFMSYEGQIILDENKDIGWGDWFNGAINYITGSFDEVCVRVVDKQFSKLVDNESLVLKSYSKLTGMDRADKYKTLGYVKSSRKFTQKETWVRVNTDDFEVKPVSYRKGKESIFTDYIEPEIKNKIGYHLYYYVLLSGYHVLMILVDNRNPCTPMYKILDQIKDRPFKELKDLNEDLLTMAKSNYEIAVERVQKVNPKAKSHGADMYLWKLKRK